MLCRRQKTRAAATIESSKYMVAGRLVAAVPVVAVVGWAGAMPLLVGWPGGTPLPPVDAGTPPQHLSCASVFGAECGSCTETPVCIRWSRAFRAPVAEDR